MLPSGLKTPHEVVLHYDRVYFSLIDSGKAHPFMYPWAGVGAFAVLAYLLIDHRQSVLLRRSRFLVFALLVAFQGWCIVYTRARNPASAFGDGLLSAWGTMWVGAIMVANDCQTDFQRIESRKGGGETIHNGTLANVSTKAGIADSTIRRRARDSPGTASTSGQDAVGNYNELYWQAYPSSPFYARLDWIADVFCSFRGVGWTWQGSGIPPLPKSIEARFHSDAVPNEDAQAYNTSRTGIRRYAHRNALVKDTTIKLVIGYFALDALATFMHRDPYFWGYMDAVAPDFLPVIVRESHVLTKSYRLLVSLGGIGTSLWTIFKLGPVFFCGVLGPRWLGVRGEAWMNPADMFGSYSLVFSKGLAGWWGGWWHQTFRFAFEAPTTRILQALDVDKRTTLGKAISLFMAFFLSGCIHASGSYTQLGDTRPLMGPMLFFLLQAVGILGQTLLVQQLQKAGVADRSPRMLCQATNFVVAHIWLYYTAPLLVDDFAKGGIWLFEPVPLSPLRGLGFGAQDDRLFCWGHGLFWWRTGKHWWDTGIAL